MLRMQSEIHEFSSCADTKNGRTFIGIVDNYTYMKCTSADSKTLIYSIQQDRHMNYSMHSILNFIAITHNTNKKDANTT